MIDLVLGSWQIPMDKEFRKVRSFSTNAGHYKCLRLLMCLRNAPLTFQTFFAGVIENGLFVYLDDLFVFSKDLDDHLKNLSLAFQKFTQAGLKIKLPKCDFLESRIEFLGHLVDRDRISTVVSRITVVKNFPTPKSVENIRSF